MGAWTSTYEDDLAAGAAFNLVRSDLLALKEDIRERIANAHEMDTASPSFPDQGQHKEGTAVAYVQSAEPTTHPDGSTAITTYPVPHLWVKEITGSAILNAYRTGSSEYVETNASTTFGTKTLFTPTYTAVAPTVNEFGETLGAGDAGYCYTTGDELYVWTGSAWQRINCPPRSSWANGELPIGVEGVLANATLQSEDDIYDWLSPKLTDGVATSVRIVGVLDGTSDQQFLFVHKATLNTSSGNVAVEGAVANGSTKTLSGYSETWENGVATKVFTTAFHLLAVL
jgi:hypothetical protein